MYNHKENLFITGAVTAVTCITLGLGAPFSIGLIAVAVNLAMCYGIDYLYSKEEGNT